jgi:hypothetical protein
MPNNLGGRDGVPFDESVAVTDAREVTETESLTVDQQKKLNAIRQEFIIPGSLNWDKVLGSFVDLEPTAEIKVELVGLIMKYITDTFRHGQFQNLDGIDKVLQYLEIDRIDFADKQMEKIMKLYGKYSQGFLLSMSPSLYNGKLVDGTPYNKINYVRQLLQKRGAPPEDLTDEHIKELWDFREILIRLHSNLRGRELTAGQRQLTDFIKILQEG